MFCPECGKAVEEGVVFCPNCGAKVGETLKEVLPPMKPTRDAKKGFFASLFDFSFTNFITSKIIKFIYALLVAFAGLIALALIFVGFSSLSRSTSTAVILAALIVSPLLFLLIVIISRISLELIIIIFRIAEHVVEIARQKRS